MCPVRPSPIPCALRHDGCDHYRPSWAHNGTRRPPLALHGGRIHVPIAARPIRVLLLCARILLLSRAIYVVLAGIEWDRAINLTYALGPVLLASHWRLAEPTLYG